MCEQSGAVYLTDNNNKLVTQQVKDKIAEAKTKLSSGEIKVFDVNIFTINSKRKTSYKIDGNDKDFVDRCRTTCKMVQNPVINDTTYSQ